MDFDKCLLIKKFETENHLIMKKIITLSLIVVAFSSNAQIRDLMLNKAGNVLNKNKGTETATDTTSKSKTTETTNSQPQMGMNFGMISKSELKSEYKFNNDALVEIQGYKKSGEKEGDLVQHRMYFSEDKYYGGEFNDPKAKKPMKSISIMEFERNILIMLSEEDSKKTGFAMKQDYSNAAKSTSADSTKHKITKTGKTKIILGYTCEEWLITNDENADKSEVWITTGVNLNILESFKMMSSSSRGNNSKKYDTNSYPKGFMMESTHYKASGEKTIWKVIELNLNKITIFKPGDYEFSM